MKDIRPKLIELCNRESTLDGLRESVTRELEHEKLSSGEKKSLLLISAYLRELYNQIGECEFTEELSLKKGVNTMDLSNFGGDIQNYIITGALREILNNQKDTIVVIPEAGKFIPQSRGTPTKTLLLQLASQGAVNRNFVWIDAQNLAGVDKAILKHVSVWLLGFQSEYNEVQHTLKQLPLNKKQKPSEEHIMNLELGEFFVWSDKTIHKTYVLPKYMPETEGRSIAMSKKAFLISDYNS